MNNTLGKEFKFFSLLKFALPSIVMMVFMSLYTMVDGMFVSRFIGTTALSAVNIVYPIYSVIIAVGIMLATGGSAVIARKMGEGKLKEGKENFSLLVLTSFLLGIIIGVLCLIFLSPMLKALGANERVFDYCVSYAKTFLMFTPLALLQMLFQYFFVTAGKPGLGLTLTVIGGLLNMILDYFFIVELNMGIMGAALATGIGIAVPAILGLLFFLFFRKGSLYIITPKFDKGLLIESCINGSSEMVTNIAVAVVTFLFNIMMMKYLGEDGVASITIALYAQFLLNAVFFGFSMGVAPVISYNYGSENILQTKNIFKYCIIFVVVASILAFGISEILAPTIIALFAEKGSSVYELTISGFGLFSLNFIFAGVNIFTSSMFTAFSNGKISAFISLMRTFVFITISILVLPKFLGVNGIWVSVTLAEFLSIIMCFYYLNKYKKEYKYL